MNRQTFKKILELKQQLKTAAAHICEMDYVYFSDCF